MKQKILTLMLAMVVTFSLGTSVYADTLSANEENNVFDTISQSDSAVEPINFKSTPNMVTVASYRSFMKNKIENDNINSFKAQELLNGFEKLSSNQKEKFISYINDSDLILDVLDAVSENKPYSSFKNGNVVVSSEGVFKNDNKTLMSRASLDSRIATGSKSVSIFGLKIFEYSGELRYTHDGKSIKSIDHANVWISQNFLPLVSFSWDDESTYGEDSSTAHHIEYCTWSFVHEKLGMTYGSHQIEITGNVYNNTTFTVQ